MTKGHRSEYGKNIITLVTGTTVAQAIPIAVSPILTRLYTPEDFGVFAIYFSASMVLSVFATGKYEMAITLPKDDEQSVHLVQLSVSIAIAVSLLLLMVVLLLKEQISFWIGLEQPHILFFLPVSTFIIGLNQSLYYYINRKKKYSKMATSRVVRAVGYSSSSVVVGFLRGNGIGLVFSDLLGQVASSFYLYRSERNHHRWFSYNKEDLMAVARKYQNFPRFSVLSGLLEKLAGQAPVFLLNRLFLSSTVGFFSFAQRIIIAPSDLITRAIGDVFRQQASEAYAQHGECKRIFISTFKRLFTISILPFLLSFFVIEDVFALIFGDPWRVAGSYAKIMLPMFFLQFIVSPLSIIFIIAQKQKYDLWMQFSLLSFVTIAFYLGYTNTHNAETCILLFTIVYCLKYLIEFIFSYRFSLGKK